MYVCVSCVYIVFFVCDSFSFMCGLCANVLARVCVSTVPPLPAQELGQPCLQACFHFLRDFPLITDIPFLTWEEALEVVKACSPPPPSPREILFFCI